MLIFWQNKYKYSFSVSGPLSIHDHLSYRKTSEKSNKFTSSKRRRDLAVPIFPSLWAYSGKWVFTTKIQCFCIFLVSYLITKYQEKLMKQISRKYEKGYFGAHFGTLVPNFRENKLTKTSRQNCHIRTDRHKFV